MTHLPRCASAHDIYHITARGVGRQIIFESDGDRAAFVRLLSELKRETDVEVYAWCLMDNHVHLLLHAPLERVSLLMRRMLGSYAMRFNALYGRVGHLFQDRFHSVPIADEEQLLRAVRYIHFNPQEAGLDYITYPWSSYAEYAFGTTGPCDTAFMLGMLDGPQGFVELHDAELPGEDALRHGTTRCHLSSDEASETVREVLGAVSPYDLKSLDKKTRNHYLARLRAAGLSVRQIERATGIGRGIISRAKM